MHDLSESEEIVVLVWALCLREGGGKGVGEINNKKNEKTAAKTSVPSLSSIHR